MHKTIDLISFDDLELQDLAIEDVAGDLNGLSCFGSFATGSSFSSAGSCGGSIGTASTLSSAAT